MLKNKPDLLILTVGLLFTGTFKLNNSFKIKSFK